MIRLLFVPNLRSRIGFGFNGRLVAEWYVSVALGTIPNPRAFSAKAVERKIAELHVPIIIGRDAIIGGRSADGTGNPPDRTSDPPESVLRRSTAPIPLRHS